MSQLQPRRSLKPVVNPRRWNRTPITAADAIAGELVQMHEQVMNERDQLMLEKQEMENKCHQFETQNMRDQQKIMDLERQIKELTKDNDQLRAQVTELKSENSSLQKVDTMPGVRHSYLDEDDSFNFIVDAYDRRSIYDVTNNHRDDAEYEQAVQMAVALIAKESATHRRKAHDLTLLVQNQDALIHKLEEQLAKQIAISHQRARASNLMLLEDMEKDLRHDSIQAMHERQQMESSLPVKDQDNYIKLNVYTSMPDSTRNSVSTKGDFATAASRRTSASSAVSRTKSRPIPPATPPPREPLPPLPLRESYTSSSARTSLSSVQSFSVPSPTTYSSSEWEKSRSSLHQYQTDLDNNAISKGEGDAHPKVTRSRSGFWRGLRSKMANKH